MTYAEKLKDPRWQKKRLQILERDNWQCQSALLCQIDVEPLEPTNCLKEFFVWKRDRSNPTLHVHHKKYRKGADPWDYPDDELITLCAPCHEYESLDERGRAIHSLMMAIEKLTPKEIFELSTLANEQKWSRPKATLGV
jgi:5-methylcytosine-specific restriction endonuclease McrA